MSEGAAPNPVGAPGASGAAELTVALVGVVTTVVVAAAQAESALGAVKVILAGVGGTLLVLGLIQGKADRSNWLRRRLLFLVSGATCILLMLLLTVVHSEEKTPDSSLKFTPTSVAVSSITSMTAPNPTVPPTDTTTPLSLPKQTVVPQAETASVSENQRITFFNGELAVAAKSIFSGFVFLNASSGATFCEPISSLEAGEYIVLTADHRFTVIVAGFVLDASPRRVTIEVRREENPIRQDVPCRFVN